MPIVILIVTKKNLTFLSAKKSTPLSVEKSPFISSSKPGFILLVSFYFWTFPCLLPTACSRQHNFFPPGGWQHWQVSTFPSVSTCCLPELSSWILTGGTACCALPRLSAQFFARILGCRLLISINRLIERLPCNLRQLCYIFLCSLHSRSILDP